VYPGCPVARRMMPCFLRSHKRDPTILVKSALWVLKPRRLTSPTSCLAVMGRPALRSAASSSEIRDGGLGFPAAEGVGLRFFGADFGEAACGRLVPAATAAISASICPSLACSSPLRRTNDWSRFWRVSSSRRKA